jgi:hypothetical protein
VTRPAANAAGGRPRADAGPEDNHEPPGSRAHSAIRIGAALAVVGAAVAALAAGSLVVKIAVVVVALCTLQGLWRGGLVLALPVALSTGRGVGGFTASLFGTTGLTNRLIAIGLVALVVTSLGGIAGRVLRRIVIRRHPTLRLWDPYAGALIGAAEGSLLAVMLLWAPLALEPIARVQMAEPDEGGTPPAPSFLAVGVAKAANQVRASALGRLAESTNPFGASDLLSLAADFAAVSRDPDAMAFFMRTPVMQRVQRLDSVGRARAILGADPELSSMFGEGGISADALKRLMDSPTVLRAFDETTVVSDLRPLEPALIEAIRQARARVRVGSNGR